MPASSVVLALNILFIVGGKDYASRFWPVVILSAFL